jgi:predicted RNase H-like HicB family nuclease
MKKSYLGAVCEGGGTFGIVFRDFPGCVSAGDTLDEVLAMGREALQGYVELMAEEGEPSATAEPVEET